MEAAARRQAILDRLRTADRPVSASSLAAELNVSRQIIVGDIAILRAGGAEISATPRGYVLPRATDGITRTIACRHTLEQTGTELDILVDNGCTVLDVIVEHPVYGQLTGQLQISSRYDTIVLGTPVWWYTCAPAMRAFLTAHDLGGKTVYPFATNGGWLGRTLKDVAALCPGADVKPGLDVHFDDTTLRTPDKTIDRWIAAIHD